MQLSFDVFAVDQLVRFKRSIYERTGPQVERTDIGGRPDLSAAHESGARAIIEWTLLCRAGVRHAEDGNGQQQHRRRTSALHAAYQGKALAAGRQAVVG